MQTTFDQVKVFSATKAKDRGQLGETVTEWLRKQPRTEIVDKQILQSSDAEFHCLTIVLFLREPRQLPVLHCLRNGRAMCKKFRQPPGKWPKGHQWLSIADWPDDARPGIPFHGPRGSAMICPRCYEELNRAD